MHRLLKVGRPDTPRWKRRIGWVLAGAAFISLLIWMIDIVTLDELSHWDLLYNQYVTENADASSGQIVFLGDSLTEGYPVSDYFESDLMLYNRGIGGDTTAGVIRRLEANVIAISPAVIILLIGVNDLHSGVSPTTILARLEEILQTLQAALPECKVYVESLYPTNPSVWDLSAFWDDIDALNPQIQALAESFGYAFVNVHDLLSDGDSLRAEYSVDGLHLNANGYSVVSDALAAAVPELTRKP